MRIMWLRLTLTKLRDRYANDCISLSRMFPGTNYEDRGDCAIEVRRNLETTVAELNGLLAMSDEALIALTRPTVDSSADAAQPTHSKRQPRPSQNERPDRASR